MRDPRYDILFEPVRIGPVTARNRFYQVPHCNGMGHAMPAGACRHARGQGRGRLGGGLHRRVRDPPQRRRHALRRNAAVGRPRHPGAGPACATRCTRTAPWPRVELVHNGPTASNLYLREVPIAPSHQPQQYGYPLQARAMDQADIREYRRWHREAAVRAMRAGFDIVYVYAGA